MVIVSTVVRAHLCVAGAPKKSTAVRSGRPGRSRGGFSTKIHIAVDALDNPLRFILTGSECHESLHASAALIAGYSMWVLISYKGYDAADFIKALRAAGVEAVIPPKVNRLEHRKYDKHLHRERHLVECFISKVKHYRRVLALREAVKELPRLPELRQRARLAALTWQQNLEYCSSY